MKLPTRIRRITREQFGQLVSSILGLRVSRAWRGHGSALFLELGRLHQVPQLRPSEPRRGPIPKKGEATVMIEWGWRVERVRSIEVGSWSTEQRIDARITRLSGARVVDVSVAGRLPELALALSGGRWIQSFKNAEGQPSWTVFLPDGSWLCVERGLLIHDPQARRHDSMP